MFEAEIGQNINEEINQIVAGGNYGWNMWEGSFKYYNREVSTEDQRSDPKMVYPDRRVRPHGPDPAAAREPPPASTRIAIRRCRS